MKERRKHFRYNVNLPVEIEMDEGNINIKTVSQNISAGGLLVEMPIRPELFASAILKINFQTIGGDEKIIPAIVARTLSKESKNDKVEKIGFIFDAIDDETREDIDKILKKAFPFAKLKESIKILFKKVLK